MSRDTPLDADHTVKMSLNIADATMVAAARKRGIDARALDAQELDSLTLSLSYQAVHG